MSPHDATPQYLDILSAEVKARYEEWTLSAVPKPQMNAWKIVVGILLCFSIAGIPLGAHFLFSGLRRRYPRDVRHEIKFIRRAELVMAAPLMINTALRQPGHDKETFPGLFLITFEKLATFSPLVDAVLAFEKLPRGASDPASRAMKEILDDEEYHAARRRAVPLEATRDKQFYAIDLAVPKAFLFKHRILDDFPFVPCLAEPGDAGITRVVPYWIVFPDANPLEK